MKVVIFCGGMGVRMGEATQRMPKPMIKVGSQPILWHIMKWYASWGHTDFILCLGHRAEVIKEYFLEYDEALGNDFVLRPARYVELLGQRHGRLAHHVHRHGHAGDRSPTGSWRRAATSATTRCFLATYGDGLTDAPLDR